MLQVKHTATPLAATIFGNGGTRRLPVKATGSSSRAEVKIADSTPLLPISLPLRLAAFLWAWNTGIQKGDRLLGPPGPAYVDFLSPRLL